MSQHRKEVFLIKLKNHGYEFDINRLRYLDNHGNYNSKNQDFINLLDEFCGFVDNYSKNVNNSSFLKHFLEELLNKIEFLLTGENINESVIEELEELRQWFDEECECRYM